MKSRDIVRISKHKKLFAVPWTYVINGLNGEEIFGMFYEKELQKPNQKEYIIEKVIKKKVINYMLIGKDIITCLIVG